MVTESPLAAIDLGTNCARLAIGHVRDDSSISKQVHRRVITRLGGGYSRDSGISEEACARTMKTLRRFAAEMKGHGVSRVRAVATSAVRDAVNGHDFVNRIYKETGLAFEIIDGREEGLLTLKGVVSGLDCHGDIFIFDIGGGSTEFTLARGGKPLFTMSLPLGVVRLTEGKSSVAAMDDKIGRELESLVDRIQASTYAGFPAEATLVGTAGTATTLASVDLGLVDFDYSKVHGHILSLDKVRRIFHRLLPMTPAERLSVPGMEKGREDLVAAGILLTMRTMEKFGFVRFTVCETGLLEGLPLSMGEKPR